MKNKRRTTIVVAFIVAFSFGKGSFDAIADEGLDASEGRTWHDREAMFRRVLMPLHTPVSFRKTKREKKFPVRPVSKSRGLHLSSITVFNVHTREALVLVDGAKPKPAVLAQIFRCRGFGGTKELDPRLFSVLMEAASYFGANRVEIISAYRSSKFNDALAKKARNVARESRHTRGEALDFRLVGIEAVEIGKWIWDNFEGGVGVYSINNFVHIDVGPKRRWYGR